MDWLAASVMYVPCCVILIIIDIAYLILVGIFMCRRRRVGKRY